MFDFDVNLGKRETTCEKSWRNPYPISDIHHRVINISVKPERRTRSAGEELSTTVSSRRVARET